MPHRRSSALNYREGGADYSVGRLVCPRRHLDQLTDFAWYRWTYNRDGHLPAAG